MNKTQRVFVRMTSAELKTAKTYSKQCGLTLSAYARKSMLKEPVSTAIPLEFYALRRDISGLCTNVNQIAHAVNSGVMLPSFAAQEACELARQTYKIVKGMLKSGGE